MRNVLFVCTQNAGRSQIAQAFFNRYAPADVRAESAGLEPADRVHPVVVESMAEAGIEGAHSAGEIRECADAVLSRYDNVPIRSHIGALAQKRAQECLRADRCYELQEVR